MNARFKFVVVKTGKRTWQVADYSTLDCVPMFELRRERFHSEFDALAKAAENQRVYDEASTKVIHEMVLVPSECSPKRMRHGKTLVELAREGLEVCGH